MLQENCQINLIEKENGMLYYFYYYNVSLKSIKERKLYNC